MRPSQKLLARAGHLRPLLLAHQSLPTPFPGTGLTTPEPNKSHSSLSYLRRFPFSKLKVDRSFVANMTTDAGTAAIVQAIITLGRSLSMRVNAEGIETEQQLEMLTAMGCDEGQGYLLGRPAPAKTFEQLIARQAYKDSQR